MSARADRHGPPGPAISGCSPKNDHATGKANESYARTSGLSQAPSRKAAIPPISCDLAACRQAIGPPQNVSNLIAYTG
jgi:hypothetical protein